MTNDKRGLLAHSAKASEGRREFEAMRNLRTTPISGGAQMKYFLLYSRAGMTCVFAFAAVMFFSGITG